MKLSEPDSKAAAPTGRQQQHGLQRILIALVRGYQLFLSAWLGGSCRFEPTCSVYALQALEHHGAVAGSYLALCRLARCQPFCTGGCDPLPVRPPALFSSRASGLHKPPAE